MVKAATGEVVSSEDLGGGDLHCKVSGVTDHLADNDVDALRIAREVVANLNHKKEYFSTITEPMGPLLSSDEIPGIIGTNLRKPFDMKQIIARLVDESKFHEFKEHYGKQLVTGTYYVDRVCSY